MKLSIEHLSVELGGNPILRDLCLQLPDGAFLALLGPSGCGKSTLLKAIAGIVPIKSGSICLGEQDITQTAIHKRGTVILFQEMRLFPHMNVEDNIAFPLKMQGIKKEERLRAAQELLEKVQLGGYGKRRIHQLSGGQQQRVALARALAARPKLLLLDEPFSALDADLRQEMRDLVRNLHNEFSMTTIMVTHDRQEAYTIADRVVDMKDGSIE